MNILVVSYVDYITDEIKKVLSQKENVSIDVAKDTIEATTHVKRSPREYDLIVIDMMVQSCFYTMDQPLLQPALIFLNQIKKIKPFIKVFALFDEAETEKRGQKEVKDLGYEIAAWEFRSIEWEDKLSKYITA